MSHEQSAVALVKTGRMTKLYQINYQIIPKEAGLKDFEAIRKLPNYQIIPNEAGFKICEAT